MELKYYYLMRKNTPITIMSFFENGDMMDYNHDIKNAELAPLAYKNDEIWLKRWWNDRALPTTRNNLDQMLRSKGFFLPKEYLIKNLGLSLTDYYWIRPVDSNLQWEDVNLFDNEFTDSSLRWEQDAGDGKTRYTPNSSLGGNIEKTWTIDKKTRYLVKGNLHSDSTESINECIATLIHSSLKYKNHSKYELIEIEGKPYKYGCRSKLFTSQEKELVTAFDLITSANTYGSDYEKVITLLGTHGLNKDEAIAFLDYLIMTDIIMSQFDRHYNNIGFLRDAKTLKIISAAPIYDSGGSMYAGSISPREESDLSGMYTRGFASSIDRMKKLVHDPGVIDLTMLPPVSKIRKLYEMDEKIKKNWIDGACFAYEKRIDECRAMQLNG